MENNAWKMLSIKNHREHNFIYYLKLIKKMHIGDI